MANFKRKKSKRVVKCTICTKYRWQGNSRKGASRQMLRAAAKEKA